MLCFQIEDANAPQTAAPSKRKPKLKAQKREPRVEEEDPDAPFFQDDDDDDDDDGPESESEDVEGGPPCHAFLVWLGQCGCLAVLPSLPLCSPQVEATTEVQTVRTQTCPA